MNIETLRLGFAPDVVPYTEAWQLQNQVHQEIVADQRPPVLMLLEHQDVYTAGKRTEDKDRPQDGTEVIDVDRGGKITWHGRGQLVGYPILPLRDRALVKDYVCALEGVIIKVLREDYGIASTRVEGRSGVWLTDGIRDRKIAAIGIRVHQSVTLHGFALNCSNSLEPFGNIIACGIADADTTTISAELGRTVNPADIADRIEEELMKVLPRFLAAAPAAEAEVEDFSQCTITESTEGSKS